MIPWTKTIKTNEATIALTVHPNNPTCPVEALHRHLEVNGPGGRDAPLFTFKSSNNGDSSAKMKVLFMPRRAEVWNGLDLRVVMDHSFRIDRATEILLKGQPPHVVQELGWWKSYVFRLCWSSVEEIIPTFLGAGVPLSSVEGLKARLNGWLKDRSQSNIK
jgi:hypothetical protein